MLGHGDLVRILSAAAASVSHERLSQAAALAFVATSSLYAAQDLGIALPEPLRIDAVPFLYPLLAIVAIRLTLHHARGPERRFWNELSLAFGCWLVPDLLRLVQVPHQLSAVAKVAPQVMFAAAYVLLVLAVDRQPHRRFVDRPLTALERLYTWPAVSFFVLGLVLYLPLVPLYYPEERPGEPSGSYLLIVLNGMLALRLLILAGAAPSLRWRVSYGLLAWVPATLVVSYTVAELLRFHPDWPIAHAPRALLELAFVFLVIAARLQQPSPLPSEGSLSGPRGEDAALALTSRTLSFALAFPLLHFAGYGSKLFDGPSEPLRELVVLTWLLLLGAMAVFQHRLLERRAEELWLERKRFEEKLSDSQQDLRLILERYKAEEAQRLAHEKFEIAFQACPYAISINRLDDATFIEVNPAFEKALARRRDEIVGRTPEELDLWSNPGDRIRLCRRLEVSDTLRRFLLILRTGSGAPAIMLLSLQKMAIRGVQAVLSISRETSQWEKVEALRRPAGLVDHLRAAVYAVDGQGRVRHWNRAAEDLLGFSPAEIRGRSAAATLSPPGTTALDDTLDEIDGLGHWQGQLVHLDRRGQEVRLAGWGTLVEGPGGGGGYRLLILEAR